MSSPEAPPTSTCAKCGRPIADGRRVEHRGAVYCLECVGRALNGEAAAPQPARRSPAVAVILSLLPGLGQMYNRQMLKGVVVLVAFLVLASAAGSLPGWEDWGMRSALIVGLYFWNLFDAYWTAQRINRAELPEVTPAWEQRAESAATPAGGVVLIILGIVFLLNNFGVAWLTFGRVWPAALLALGIWLLISFALSRRGAPGVEPDSPQPAPADPASQEVHRD